MSPRVIPSVSHFENEEDEEQEESPHCHPFSSSPEEGSMTVGVSDASPSSDGRGGLFAEEARRLLVGSSLLPSPSFPWRLHKLLEDAQQLGFQHIVSWQPGGNAFKVHDHLQFVSTIIKIYFNQTQYKSFQRQLNIYGFQSIAAPQEQGRREKRSYTHELFIRGEPEKCLYMVRTKVKRKGWKNELLPALPNPGGGGTISNGPNRKEMRPPSSAEAKRTPPSSSCIAESQYSRRFSTAAQRRPLTTDDVPGQHIFKPQDMSDADHKQQARTVATTKEEVGNCHPSESVPRSPSSSGTASAAAKRPQDDDCGWDHDSLMQDWSTSNIVGGSFCRSAMAAADDEVYQQQAHVAATTSMRRHPAVRQPRSSMSILAPLGVMQNMARTSPKCIVIPPEIIDEIIDIFGGENRVIISSSSNSTASAASARPHDDDCGWDHDSIIQDWSTSDTV
jgi:hypothetical protein